MVVCSRWSGKGTEDRGRAQRIGEGPLVKGFNFVTSSSRIEVLEEDRPNAGKFG